MGRPVSESTRPIFTLARDPEAVACSTQIIENGRIAVLLSPLTALGAACVIS